MLAYACVIGSRRSGRARPTCCWSRAPPAWSARVRGGELGGRGLDDLACLGEIRQGHALQLDQRRDGLRDAVGVRFFDERAAGRADLDTDQTAGLQDAQRIAHGDAGDAELLGELALRLQAV